MSGSVADWEALVSTDPEVADAIASELRRERTTIRLVASENYASPAVLAALASTMNNKYAEGYPRSPLLRRVRERGRRRAPGGRAGEGALRRGARERPAARGGAGQPGGARGVLPASIGRYGARARALARRAPDARIAGQHLRDVVPVRELRGGSRDRDARHGPDPRPRAGAPPQDPARRVHRLPSPHRLRGLPSHRGRGRRAAVGRCLTRHRSRGGGARTRAPCRTRTS